MPSVNEELADRIRIQAVSFERFAADVRRRVLALLLAMEQDIIAQLRAIDPTEPLRKTYRDARLAKLLEQTRASIVGGYRSVNKEMTADLIEVADISAAATVLAVNEVVGVEIMTVALAPEMFRALVDDTMILGAPSTEWWAKQAGDAVFRFKAAVQQGYAQGETVEQIVRRVKGTRAANYRDGIMELTRRNATSLVHTSVQAISNSARLEAFRANGDVLDGVQQISTMDSRTCLIKNSTILALNGMTRPIQDIQAGDIVIGGSRQPRTVLATKKATTRCLAKVVLDDGREILCTPDHLFLTQENSGQAWIEAQDLLPNTEISCKLDIA